MPRVNAYFLLPQKASVFLTSTIFMLECALEKASITSRVLSCEASLISTISKVGYYWEIIEGKKFFKFSLSFLAQIITEISIFFRLFSKGLRKANFPKKNI